MNLLINMWHKELERENNLTCLKANAKANAKRDAIKTRMIQQSTGQDDHYIINCLVLNGGVNGN
jgi:hypothetical protein